MRIACASLMPCAEADVQCSDVDIFNATSGVWSTAALSVARVYLAATSLPNLGVAIFAGGLCACCSVVDFFSLLPRGLLCEGYACIGGVCCVDRLCESHALRSGLCPMQRCGHLQRDLWGLEHCSSQRSSILSCSHIAAESWSRDLCWWL